MGMPLILFHEEVDSSKTNTSTPLSNCVVLHVDSSQFHCFCKLVCDLNGLETFFFLVSPSVSICIKMSSKLPTFEMVTDESRSWVHFCLSSTSSARHLISAPHWRAYQFLKPVFHGQTLFKGDVSGF
jgi:hypothetical protein